MNQGDILFLSEKEVTALVDPAKVPAMVEKVLSDFSAGKTVNPIKLSLQVYPYHECHINSMPSYNAATDVAGVKVISVCADNIKKYGVPTTIGTMILNDPDSGMPYSIMGGTRITELRTGAASAISAKYLTRRDSRVLTVVGAGAQGYMSVRMCLLEIPSIQEVRICDLSDERCAWIVEAIGKEFPGVSCSRLASHKDACVGSEIVIYATNANRSLLEGCEIAPGTTVVVVSEVLTPAIIRRFDKFYFDFTGCALERYNSDGRHSAELRGEVYEDLTEDLVTGELGDVISGKAPGRESDDEIIMFAAVGMSVEDVIVAREAYDRALERGVGRILPFQDM